MKSDKSQLKYKAEKVLQQRGVIDEKLYSKNLEELIEELQIYQIEMEFQNDELNRIRQHQEDLANKYADLYHNAPAGYLIIENELHIVECNNTFAKMIGLKNEHLNNQKFTDYIHPASQDKFYKYINEFKRNTGADSVRITLNTNDHRNLVCLLDSKLIQSNSSDEKQIRISVTDISKENEYEVQLKREKNFWESSFEFASDGIMIVDENDQIIQCNKRLVELLNLKKEEVIHEKYYKVLWKNPNQIKDSVISESVRSKSFFSEQYFLEHLKIHVKISANPILGENEPTGYVVVSVVDISAQIEHENDLKTAKLKAEESDRLKSAFLANMSHEIRTPINTIVGFSRLLKEDDNISEEKRVQFSSIIEERSKDLLRIINDIIDISKIEAAQLSIHKKVFNVKMILNNLFTYYINQIERLNPNVKLELKIDDNVNEYVESDVTRFKQIFTNLLNNAIRFTEKGVITMGVNKVDKHLLFFVEDSGIGIDEEFHQLIFQRFRQSDNIGAVRKGGNGLGLAITKSLVEKLGGEIWVESLEKQGATFYVKFPLNALKTTNPEKETELDNLQEEYSKFNPHVLLVEDDEYSILFIREVLKSIGCEITHTSSGKQAIKMAKESDFDLILMDIKIDDIDGATATREIRKFNTTVPVFAQTAYVMQSDQEEFKSAGCNEFLSKPIDKNELIKMIAKYRPAFKPL